MSRPTAERLHDGLLSRGLALLPLDADAPAHVAGETSGVPYHGWVGAWSPHGDVRVTFTLWPAEGPRSVTLDQWVHRRGDGGFGGAPYEMGALRLPRDSRGRVEAFLSRSVGTMPSLNEGEVIC